MLNVITDNWIRAQDLDGTIKMIGIREAIVNAEKYRGIVMADEDPMFEYCVYRLLGGFVQAAYNIDYQIEWLEDSIPFDASTFDAYVAKCEENGTSFDAFDKEKPFMQITWGQLPDSTKKYIDVPLNQLSEKASAKEINASFLKPVSKISLYDVSATNRIFGFQLGKNARKYRQTHKNADTAAENQCELSEREFFLNLLVTQLGLTPAGSSASVTKRTGSGPVYFVIQGKNLWETLLLNCGEKYDGIPIWEWKTYAPELYCVKNNGWLTELFIPCRNIRYGGVDENGMVTTVYFADRNFKDYKDGVKVETRDKKSDVADIIRKAWITSDPYIMTYRKKDDELAFYSMSDDSRKTNEEYNFILQYFSYLASGSYPSSYAVADELDSKKNLKINAYYQYEKDKGNVYYGSFKKEYPLIPEITRNVEEQKTLRKIVNYVETVGVAYEKQLSLMAKIMVPSDKKAVLMLKDTYTRPFYSVLQNEIADNYMKYINDESGAMDAIESLMKKTIKKANTDFVSQWIMEWLEKVQMPVLKAIRNTKEKLNDQ